MTTARFIAAIAVLLFGACIVVTNWVSVIQTARNKKRGIDGYHSTIPVISILLSVLAYMLYPELRKIWIFSVPLLDIANWRLLCPSIVFARKPKGADRAVPPDRRRP